MTSDRWFPGYLGKQARAIWHFRYWLMVVVGLVFFVLMMFAPSSTETSIETGWRDRMGFALVFCVLGTLLAGWFASLVHAAGTRSVRWFVALMCVPPLAAVYLIKHQGIVEK